MADELRVLIVADDPLARAGLATLLTDQAGCLVVGQVAGQTDWSAQLDVYQPDAILWDLGWSPDETLEQVADLAELSLPIVALLSDESYVLEAWGAGIRGLLLRNVNAESLLASLAAIAQGLVLLDPYLARALVPTMVPESLELIEDLTPRELEVLGLLAEGLPNKAIARKLNISDHTVKFHVNAILSKLGAQSRTEAVVRATRLGLILL